MQQNELDLQGDEVKKRRLAKLQSSSSAQSKPSVSTPSASKPSPPPIKQTAPIQSPSIPAQSPSKPNANSVRFLSQSDDEWQTEVLSKIHATDEAIITMLEGCRTQDAFNSLVKSYTISLKVCFMLMNA
jgi:hypothetical protein